MWAGTRPAEDAEVGRVVLERDERTHHRPVVEDGVVEDDRGEQQEEVPVAPDSPT